MQLEFCFGMTQIKKAGLRKACLRTGVVNADRLLAADETVTNYQ